MYAHWPVLRGQRAKGEKGYSTLSGGGGEENVGYGIYGDLIDWSGIREKLDEMYDNKREKGGRFNCDVILMFKMLIL